MKYESKYRNSHWRNFIKSMICKHWSLCPVFNESIHTSSVRFVSIPCNSRYGHTIHNWIPSFHTLTWVKQANEKDSLDPNVDFIQKQYPWTHAVDIVEHEFVSGWYESSHESPGCSMADDIYLYIYLSLYIYISDTFMNTLRMFPFRLWGLYLHKESSYIDTCRVKTEDIEWISKYTNTHSTFHGPISLMWINSVLHVSYLLLKTHSNKKKW